MPIFVMQVYDSVTSKHIDCVDVEAANFREAEDVAVREVINDRGKDFSPRIKGRLEAAYLFTRTL